MMQKDYVKELFNNALSLLCDEASAHSSHHLQHNCSQCDKLEKGVCELQNSFIMTCDTLS